MRRHYVVLGYDVNGVKDILGIWIGEAEGKHYWMQIFDEIKSRGVEDILFISMDGVSGLEEGAKSIFKDVVRSEMYCSFNQELNKVRSYQGLQSVHNAAEERVRSFKSEGCISRI